jgi:hypothetical protein
MPVNLNMVIDIGGRLFPLGELVSMGRQRSQRRSIDGLEKMTTGRPSFVCNGTLVEQHQLLIDSFIQFCQREESVVPLAPSGAQPIAKREKKS